MTLISGRLKSPLLCPHCLFAVRNIRHKTYKYLTYNWEGHCENRVKSVLTNLILHRIIRSKKQKNIKIKIVSSLLILIFYY